MQIIQHINVIQKQTEALKIDQNSILSENPRI